MEIHELVSLPFMTFLQAQSSPLTTTWSVVAVKESLVPVAPETAVDILGYGQDDPLNVKASRSTAKAVQRRDLTSGAINIMHLSTSPTIRIMPLE
ncbi:hypothetical protein MTO96_021183 [Rhipicephalus appendiculatus]